MRHRQSIHICSSSVNFSNFSSVWVLKHCLINRVFQTVNLYVGMNECVDMNGYLPKERHDSHVTYLLKYTVIDTFCVQREIKTPLGEHGCVQSYLGHE